MRRFEHSIEAVPVLTVRIGDRNNFGRVGENFLVIQLLGALPYFDRGIHTGNVHEWDIHEHHAVYIFVGVGYVPVRVLEHRTWQCHIVVGMNVTTGGEYLFLVVCCVAKIHSLVPFEEVQCHEEARPKLVECLVQQLCGDVHFESLRLSCAAPSTHRSAGLFAGIITEVFGMKTFHDFFVHQIANDNVAILLKHFSMDWFESAFKVVN